MSLLKASKYEVHTNQPPELSLYAAWLELITDNELRYATLAANVNILRRDAPFAYIFAYGYSVKTWRAGDIGDELAYVRSLDSLQLSNTPCLPETGMVVTAILHGDILPLVHLLDRGGFWLLCLPSYHSLEQIN